MHSIYYSFRGFIFSLITIVWGMFLKYKSTYILFPFCLIIFYFEAIMMILKKLKDCTYSSVLKSKVGLHIFLLHIDGLIELYSWCKIHLTYGEKKCKWSYSSRNRNQPISLLQDIDPYPKSPSTCEGLKDLKDALSHSLSDTERDSFGWCSIVLKLSFPLAKREEVKHLLLKNFT